ncbi:oxidoreductase/transition metal ion-binding protein (DUF3531) [Wolffia australiana]
MFSLRCCFPAASISPATAAAPKILPVSRNFLRLERKRSDLCSNRSILVEARREKDKAEAVEVEVVTNSDGSEVFVEDIAMEDEDLSSGSEFIAGEGPEYDKDPEFAEILGACFDEPEKAQARVEERIRKKRSKILHAKTGSSTPMKVTFNKLDFSNSYIWFEFYNAPLGPDISLICDAIRSWHIIGRLGGCNSMNMQLSQLPLDHKRPTYDAIQGANVTPTTFYNIGDLEIQDNLARIWVDIGTTEPLLIDVLINALVQISSDYVGIKQVMFGGSKFENWTEKYKSDDAGCSVHKI